MAILVGEPFKVFYVSAYALPSLAVHNPLIKVLEGARSQRRLFDHYSLLISTDIFFAILEKLNVLFGVKLDAELRDCHKDFVPVLEKINLLYSSSGPGNRLPSEKMYGIS